MKNKINKLNKFKFTSESLEKFRTDLAEYNFILEQQLKKIKPIKSVKKNTEVKKWVIITMKKKIKENITKRIATKIKWEMLIIQILIFYFISIIILLIIKKNFWFLKKFQKNTWKKFLGLKKYLTRYFFLWISLSIAIDNLFL